MAADGGGRTISLKIEGVFNAGSAGNVKGWLADIQKQNEKSTKETLEYAIRSAKAETQAREDEAKRQKKIADDMLAYNIKFAQKNTKAQQDEMKKLERQLETDLTKSQRLHEQTNRAIERSAKATADVQIREARRTAKEFAATFNQGGGGGNVGSTLAQIFGGSFLGTLAGGGVLGIINAGISGVMSLAGTIKDLGVDAVKMGGDFEVSINSMRVFTGSTALAKAELASMDELARNTAGLRMLDAEQGAVRLRALGFEAKTAQDFVVGLAKQKLLSGADEGAMQRVVVNLTQLASGSPRMNQDIKEMIQSMPTLRNAIIGTFGSIAKFKSELQRDPDGALKKFAAGLKDTQAASAGLNDAIGKGQDSLITAGRTFAEPILEPLTNAVKDLTTFVNDNQSTWRSWGQSVGDAIRGVSDLASGVKAAIANSLGDAEAGAISAGAGFLGQVLANIGTAGLYGGYKGLESLGESQRKQIEQKRSAQAIDRFGALNPNTLQTFANRGFTFDSGGPLTDAESTAAENRKAQKIAADAERARLLEVETSKSINGLKLALLSDSFAVEEAKRDSHLRFTLQQELAFQKESTNAKRTNLQAEILAQKAFYDRQITLADGQKAEIEKISIERDKTLSALNRQYYENEYKAQKQLAMLEKQIADQKRQALIELKSIQISSVGFGADSKTFDIERAIGRSVDGAQDEFKRLIEVTNNAYVQTSRLTRETYAEQLKDQSLTAEQRVNIEAKMHLDLQQLAENNRRALIQIDDRKREKYLENLKRQRDADAEQFQYLSSRAAALQGGFFNPQSFGSSTLEKFKANVLGGDLRSRSTSANAASREASSRYYDALKSNLPQQAIDALAKAESNAGIKAAELNRQLVQLEAGIPANYNAFAKLADTIGTKNVKAFDDLSTAMLKHRQALDAADVQGEIDYYETLLASETDLNKRRDLNFQLQKARHRAEKLQIDQITDSTDNYANSLDGLAEKLRNLRGADDKTRAGSLYQARKQILGEQISLAEENILLEERLARVGENAADRYRSAWLRAQLDVKDASIQARESIIRSNVILDDSSRIHGEQVKATFLKHLEEQRSATQVTADLLTNIYDKAAEGLDKLIDRGGVGKIPILGDYLKGMARVQLTKVARSLADFLPDDMKGLAEGLAKPHTGNPLLDESIQQTAYLKDIAGAVTGKSVSGIAGALGSGAGGKVGKFLQMLGIGGSGPGGTPMFNPNGTGSEGTKFNSFAGALTGGGETGSGKSGGGMFSGLSSMFGPKKNLLNGKMSSVAGIGSGIGSLAAIAGGMIGGRAGNVLSMAGTGAQIGANFGPWGMAAGAGIGALIGLFSGRDNAVQKLKDAASSEFGISVKDKQVLNSLKSLGEGMFGKGKVGPNAVAVVRSDEGSNILRAYAESSGQSGTKIDRLSYGDPNWSGNQFNTKFGGFRAMGGGVREGYSYLVGESGPEYATFPRSGEVISNDVITAAASGGNNREIAQMIRELKTVLQATMETNEGLRQEVSRMQGISPDHVVAMGASGASKEIADAYHYDLDNDGNRASDLYRKLGAMN